MSHLQTGVSNTNRTGRRRFLKTAGFGALGIIGAGFLPRRDSFADAKAVETSSDSAFMPDLDFSLTARAGELDLFPGGSTPVWQYQAVVHKGDRNRVVQLPQSYLGPIIRVNRGEKIRIRFTSQIPEESIVHWHGMHVPAIMDGHPRHVISQGRTYLYEFEVKNRAGTYWYHPHPHGRTGPQVYRGLAGLLIVSDEEERAIGLPDGDHDVPLILQDRTFDADNRLVYISGHMMNRMTGFVGDRILVNGRPDFILPAASTAYRLRLLNGSNSRIYRLAWKDGSPLTVIGTDGGLLAEPVRRRSVFLAPGERIELWADFSDHPVGYRTQLISLPFAAGAMGGGAMGRGMMGGGPDRGLANLPVGAGFPVFEVSITRKGTENRRLPQRLAAIEPPKPSEAVNMHQPKQFYLTMRHMQWSINGRVFRMEAVAADEVVRLGTKEVWEFYNTGGGMMRMMDMPHPIHLHGKQFRVLSRGGVRHRGYVDEGWKDTVLLMPGERVRILVDFADYPGMFLYHCHNLEHEDMGMMRNYYIQG